MKILQINCVYPRGATGQITAAIHHRLLSEGHTSTVLYSRGSPNAEPHTFRVSGTLAGKYNHLISMLTGDVYGGCGLQTRRIIRYIKRHAPELVHLQCINGYFVNIYRLLGFLKAQGIPTVLTLHADFMFTANCGVALDCNKWQNGCGSCPELRRATHSLFFDRTHASFVKMQKVFDGFGDQLKVVAVSDWLGKRAAMSPIMRQYPLMTIRNGIDTEIFRPRGDLDVKAKLHISAHESMILWVSSAFSKEKGADEFLSLSEAMRGQDYRFVMVGADKPANYEGDVIFTGKIANPELLAVYYSAADVMLCCSKQESLPTVCLEAQCCGTPVVAFDVGGVSETIGEGMGELVPLGDIFAMAAAVARQAKRKSDMTDAQTEAYRRAFDESRMTDAYLSLYESMLSREN
ncbi:MAG: glycosyltransferase [Clostridia bacterium]|nr:glycosyltransferase [Clostridia bacterium]